jgi:hypothetical protein
MAEPNNLSSELDDKPKNSSIIDESKISMNLMGITFHPHTKDQRFDSWIFFLKICFKSSI